MKRKFIIYIALLTAVLFLATSCGKEKIDDKVPAPKGPVTITFATFYEEGVQADAYKEIIKVFEAINEGIKVNLQSGAVNYDEKIKTALSEGKGPDIIGLQRTRMLEHIESGNLMDLSSWVGDMGLKDKYYGVSLGYGKYNDKYYGVGDLPHTIEWYYNVDMFKKAGLKEPESLDDLINACKKLKTYTRTPIMIGAKDPWALNTFFGMITNQTVNTNALSKAFAAGDKQAFLDLEGAGSAVTIIDKLLKSGAIDKSVMNYDYAASLDAFVKGKSAILPMGSWSVDRIDEMKPKGFNYKSFENPVLLVENPNSKYSATAVQVIAVNGKTKHKEAVMKFMSFLFSEEAQYIIADKNGTSGMKLANAREDGELKKQVLRHLEATDENSTLYVDNITAKMMDATGNRLQRLINGRSKASEVWSLIVNESYN